MDIRYIAKIIIEAETPLSVGSGQKGLLIDRLVAKDANNLPYVPGTSLCGVLRHAFYGFDSALTKNLFGFGGEDGTGSRVKISAAHLVSENGSQIIEGLQNINFESDYYAYFNRLPERDHVRMTDKGVADSKNHGKYDEQLVHKGTRFAFEIELLGSDSDKPHWVKLLNLLASPIFRIGAGTRKGFGKIKVIKELSVSKIFNLRDKNDLLNYLQKSSSLNSNTNGWTALELSENQNIDNWTNYSLTLHAKDFFLFSAGFGDEDADAKPKTESFFEWNSGKPILTQKEYLLIPATSIKGAIAHRVAYNYNKLKRHFIGTPSVLNTSLDIEEAVNSFDFEIDINSLNYPSDSTKWEELEAKINAFNFTNSTHWQQFETNLDEEVHKLDTSEDLTNDAVTELFGFGKDSEKDSKKEKQGQRGRVIINDIYLPYQSDKVFNHTKIDRFTNGTIDGALFQEKAAHYDSEFVLDIWVENVAFNGENIKDALENTLFELVEGKLQLGGNTTKGHGIFTGIVNKN